MRIEIEKMKSFKRKNKKENQDESWRENITEKLLEYFDEDYAKNVEKALYMKVLGDMGLYGVDYVKFKYKYAYHLKTLLYNLKWNKNFLEKIKKEKITEEELVRKTPIEMYPEKWEKIKNKKDAEEKFLYETKEVATSSRIMCFKCKEKQVQTTEMQTRSADEPMTTFYRCLNCNHRWKN